MFKYNTVKEYITFLNDYMSGKTVNDLDANLLYGKCEEMGLENIEELNSYESMQKFVDNNFEEFSKDTLLWDEYFESSVKLVIPLFLDNVKEPLPEGFTLSDAKTAVLEAEKESPVYTHLETMFGELERLSSEYLIDNSTYGK